jgi:hypothetical protein
VTVRHTCGQAGAASIYRSRDLVPDHQMPKLSEGFVIVANWHVLEPQEGNQVGGVGAAVVKRDRLSGGSSSRSDSLSEMSVSATAAATVPAVISACQLLDRDQFGTEHPGFRPTI